MLFLCNGQRCKDGEKKNKEQKYSEKKNMLICGLSQMCFHWEAGKRLLM